MNADSEGWVENISGKCPVSNNNMLDVRIFEENSLYVGEANIWNWKLNITGHITHWRLHKPVEDISPAEKLVRLFAEKSGSELLRSEGNALGLAYDVFKKHGDSCISEKQHSHYFKDVSNLSHIDVYRVLSLFNVTDPCLQHSIKKLLVAGGRGAGKDIGQDVQEAQDSLERWKAMREEDNEQT